jgi:hypothetical protein
MNAASPGVSTSAHRAVLLLAQRGWVLDMLFVLSIWNLNFLRGWRDMIFASSADHIFMPLPQTVDYVALLILVPAGAAISFFVLRAIRTYATRFENILFLGFVAVISIGFTDYLRGVVGGGKIALYLVTGLAPVILGILLWQQSRTLLARAVFFAGLVLVPFAISNILQAVWHIAALQSEGAQSDGSEPIMTGNEHGVQSSDEIAGGGHHRVVWLVFDELDERALFGDQRSGYEYETFDQVRAQSMHYSQVTAIGGLTLYAMPGFWLGTRVTKSQPVDSDNLSVTLQGTSSEVLLNDLKHLSGRPMKRGCTQL